MRRHTPGILAALPCALAALTFLVTWIRPQALGGRMVRDLTCLMMMEFVMMHANAMLSAMPMLAATRGGKLRIVIALAVPYSLFAVGLPLAWGAPWLVAQFVILLGGKLWAVRQLPDDEQQRTRMLTWGATILAYMLFVLLAAVFPFPRFGIEAEWVRPPGGDRFPNPHRIVAAGFLYWSALATALYYLHRQRIPPARRPAPVAVDAREPAEVA